jgi:hypothetical protein
MNKADMLIFLKNYKDRDETVTLLERILVCHHDNLLSTQAHTNNAHNASVTMATLNKINANGNVGLQLTSMVIELV